MGRTESSTSSTPSPNGFGPELTRAAARVGNPRGFVRSGYQLASMAELSSYLFCGLELINLPRKRV
jgi:hypothetical protein